MKKGEEIIICISIILILISPIISADLFGWIKKTITGRLSSQPTNVSVTISGTTQCIVEHISSNITYTPTEAGSTAILFYVTMYDADGVNDLDDSSVKANFTMTGEEVRLNDSCVKIGADLDAYRANYSCTVNMLYWDGNGQWNITVSGNDLGNQTAAINTTKNFTYSLLKAMVINPTGITFPSMSPGDTNVNSSNDPTEVNNTGNYNGTINITGYDLLGATDASEVINASNFTAGIENECDVTGVNATFLINSTSVTINNTIANRGNLSAGSNKGQELVYYCIPGVPTPLSSQSYETNVSGFAWTIVYP